MQLNKKVINHTHEGGKADIISPEKMLRRSVMACMLWENQFYEDGETIADRINKICYNVSDVIISQIAIEARENQKLRHVPLLLCKRLASKGSKLTAETLSRIIQRPDELSEFLAIYWKDGKVPISKQIKKGLASAFTKFNEYQLAKYNRDGNIKLRDVLFLCHAKPKDDIQSETWKKLIDNKLEIPDTWETNLSSGKDKKETFERLISENKLGALAFLRNIRNMIESGIKPDFIKSGLEKLNVEKVLPFRFISASKYAPMLESEFEKLMFKCLEKHERLNKKTVLLIDTSGSMSGEISKRSDLTRLDSAKALSMLLREICDDARVFTFNNNITEIPNRRGFALSDSIGQPAGGTYLGAAVNFINQNVEYDRLIIITDEQTADVVPNPKTDKSYMINIASCQNGIGYNRWIKIDGWSESIIDYIISFEKLDKPV